MELMTERFGDRTSFAIEVGPPQSPGLQLVDVWAGGQRLTRDDNLAYVPFLLPAMRATADQVRRRQLPGCPFPGLTPQEVFRRLHADEGEFRESFWFLQWGEIVDNLTLYTYLDDLLVLMFEFWREPVAPGADRETFVASLPPDEFVGVVDAAAEAIRTWEHPPSS